MRVHCVGGREGEMDASRWTQLGGLRESKAGDASLGGMAALDVSGNGLRRLLCFAPLRRSESRPPSDERECLGMGIS